MNNCKGCGGCCSNILPVASREIKRIRQYIRKHRIKEVLSLNPLDCPFCDITKTKDKCLIYDVRPEICRAFSCTTEIKRLAAKQMKPVLMREIFFGGKDAVSTTKSD